MNRFIDSPFYQALCGIVDLVIMNVLFLLCCLPVFTIGASVTALNSSTHMLITESPFSAKRFIISFKAGFKQSTLAFFAGVIGAVILILDSWIISLKMQSFARYPILGIILSVLIIWVLSLSYFFHLSSATEHSFKDKVLLSVYSSLKYLPRSIVTLVLSLIPILLFFLWSYAFMVTLIFWLLIGFSLISYVNSLLLRPTFQTTGKKF